MPTLIAKVQIMTPIDLLELLDTKPIRQPLRFTRAVHTGAVFLLRQIHLHLLLARHCQTGVKMHT